MAKIQALFALLVGFGLGCVLIKLGGGVPLAAVRPAAVNMAVMVPKKMTTQPKQFLQRQQPVVVEVDVGRRGLLAGVIGSMLIGSQAGAKLPNSEIVSKCSKETGKCPPLIETLIAQGEANKAANEKNRKQSMERMGYTRTVRLSYPNSKKLPKSLGGTWKSLTNVNLLGDQITNGLKGEGGKQYDGQKTTAKTTAKK